jgi:hypothetical protein
MPELSEVLADDGVELYYDKERGEIADAGGNVLAVAKGGNGQTMFEDAAIQAEGRVCVSSETRAKKVCAEWNGQKVCLSWETVEFDICLEWANTE